MGATTSRRRSMMVGDASIPHDPSRAPLGDAPPEPAEILIKEARRRQRRRWVLSVLSVATLAGLVAGLLAMIPPSRPTHPVAHPGAGPSIALPTGGPFPPVRAPHTFVAARPLTPNSSGPSAVTIDNAATGSVEHVLMPINWHGMHVNATAVDRAGRVWVTLANGPKCTNDTSNCGAVPDSCAGDVLRIDPQTGRAMVVAKASRDERISDAQPSPNGKYLAYVDGICAPTRGQYLKVRDLVTGRAWTIGKGLAPCTALSSLAWSTSGNDLAVEYSASYCNTSPPSELAVVPALRSASGLPGHRVRMGADCQADAVAGTSTGYAVVEACGADKAYRTGPAFLLLFDRSFRGTSRTSVGSCLGTNAELYAAPGNSDLVVATYRQCNPLTLPLPPVTPPRSTVLFTDTGRGPKTIFDSVTGYRREFSLVSW